MTRIPVRRQLEYVVFRLARVTWSVLPEPWALAMGTLMGLFAGSVLRVRRRDVDRHLGWAFPDRSARWRRRVARASYRHLGREAVVMFRAGGWSAERVRERTRMVGFDDFLAAATPRRGVVVLTGHLGNWEIGGAAIAVRDVPLDAVGKGMSSPRFESDLFAARERLGIRVIKMGDAPRAALRSLGRGRVVALVGDQSAHSDGVPVPFFRRPAATARGPALLAIRSGAPVFVAFALRDRGSPQRYTVTFEPLAFSPSGDVDGDVRSLLEAYTRVLEAAIREAPDQYLWQHRRWKGPLSQEPPSEG